MFRTARAPGLVLAIGLAAVMAAGLAPAGLGGRPVPAASWLTWCAVMVLALAGFVAAGVRPVATLRRLAWLVPVVALLAVPAGLLAEPGARLVVTCGLALRAFASASAAAALASLLGPVGIVAGARQLRVPARLVEIFAAALSGLTIAIHQVGAMLRAREARRPGYGAWPQLIRSPGQTARGVGRLVAALLLRSLERGEALERSRRARGGGGS
jgi:energy-coupling factor transporter transmembrane protein EcfT